MAAFDASGHNKSTTLNATVSASITVGAGSDRILLAFVSWLSFGGTSTVTSVKLNATTAFTRLDGNTFAGDGATWGNDCWYLLDPASGADTVDVTMAGNCEVKYVAGLAYSGRNTTGSGLGTLAKTTGLTAATSITVAPSSSVGDTVVGNAIAGSATGSDLTSSDTQRTTDGEVSAEGSAATSGEKAGAAGTTTLTWAKSGGTTVGSSQLGVAILAASAATSDFSRSGSIAARPAGSMGPRMRRALVQRYPDSPVTPVELTQSSAAPFKPARGPGMGPMARRRLPQRFPDAVVVVVSGITYPQLERFGFRGEFRGEHG